MTTKPDPYEWFGAILGNLLQGGVMIWAAVETTGALRICCWFVVGIIALGLIVRATKPQAEARR